MRDALITWYGAAGRDLPWRRTRDPYAVLVSEVMLQQTQVARVVERWERWIARWPDPAALAAAAPAEVLGEWVGLGYNRRALRLREACAAIARDGWPEDLTALPGVGRYTADAVRAFAFGEPVVPVDVNVARVFSRAGAMEGPPELGQALMDLGATICTARRPRCGECPLVRCRSRGRVAEPKPPVRRGTRPLGPGTGGRRPGRGRAAAGPRARPPGARAGRPGPRRPDRPRRRRRAPALTYVNAARLR
jgi:A/G-specific adenine glycosylase